MSDVVSARRQGTKVWTPISVGAFVNILEPKSIVGSDEKTYSMVFLLDDKDDLAVFEDAAKEAAVDKWGADAEKHMKHPKFKSQIKDQGDFVSQKTGDLYAGFTAGKMCVQGSIKASQGKPNVVDGDLNPIMDKAEVYSGAKYRATLNAYAWQHPVGGKGISFSLQNVQKVGDGDRLGGGISKVTDDFEPISKSSEDSDWD